MWCRHFRGQLFLFLHFEDVFQMNFFYIFSFLSHQLSAYLPKWFGLCILPVVFRKFVQNTTFMPSCFVWNFRMSCQMEPLSQAKEFSRDLFMTDSEPTSSIAMVPTYPGRNCRKISDIIKTHQIPKLKWFSSRLAVVFAQSLEARCQVENEDVVGAAPTCDAPTTSEWSIIWLPTKVSYRKYKDYVYRKMLVQEYLKKWRIFKRVKPKNDMMYHDIYNCICQNTKK